MAFDEPHQISVRSRSFDQVAELYDRYRPAYPEVLIDRIIQFSSIPSNGDILEVGSGTGKATLPFARRGYGILCVEPGANLVALAQYRLRGYPRVRYEVARFEDWRETENGFELMICAQAFHWIPYPIGLIKASRALKPSGTFAVFWNRLINSENDIDTQLDAVCRRWYSSPPTSQGMTKAKLDEDILRMTYDIEAGGYFPHVEVERFAWIARYTSEEYIGLLHTYTDHLALSPESQKGLFGDLANVIEQHGGLLERTYVTVAYLVRNSKPK